MSKLPSSQHHVISIGQTLDEKYRVLDVLGEGAMGTVYSAWHLGLEQRVAVKLLRCEDDAYDGIARQRFQREARAAARIQNQHVCRVLDTGTLGDSTPYLVMEHLDGCDLATELAKRGRLPLAEAVRHVRQTCSALGEAHRAGIVHRDLKPANLFLHVAAGGERVIKILDFGVSKSIANSAQHSLTRTSALVGSPIYMSPEQLKSSRDVDGRTDLWALGSVLVELLTGRAPFDEETIGQLVNAVLHKQPPSLAELGFVAPEGLDAVIQRALHKDCEQRYQTAEELSAALLPFETASAQLPLALLSGLSLSTVRPLSMSVAVRSVATAGSDSQPSHSRDKAVSARLSSLPSPVSRRRAWPLLMLVAGAAIGALAVLFLGMDQSAATRSVPALPAAQPASHAVSAPVIVNDAAALRSEPQAEPPLSTGTPEGALRPAAARVDPTERPIAERRRVSQFAQPAVQQARVTPVSARTPEGSLRAAPAEPGAPQLPNFGGRR